MLTFKSEDDAKVYFDTEVFHGVVNEDGLSREDLFTDWLESTEMIIEDLEDTKQSDQYDYDTHR